MAPTSSGAVAALTAAAASAVAQQGGGQAAANPSTALQASNFSPMTGSGGSGGGNDTTVNPDVVLSGGYVGGGGVGSASISVPVSIGTIMNVQIYPDPYKVEQLETVTVGGMSNISSYFSTAPNAVAPENMTLGHNVNTQPAPNILANSAETGFIVDADPRQYTIDVKVTYVGGDSGETKITFTSTAPTGTMTVMGQGQANMLLGNTGLIDNNPTGGKYQDGIDIDASTTPIAGITGNFMIMQTATVSMALSSNCHNYVMKSPNGPSIDNGAAGDPAQIGHKVDPVPLFNSAPTDLGGFGWTLPVTVGQPPNQITYASGTYGFGDSPTVPLPAGVQNLQSLTVGSTGGNPPVPGGNPETFTTYLMYMPGNFGVWVALSKVDWGWGGSANAAPGGTTLDPNTLSRSDSGAAQVTQPLGGTAAFPTWTASTQTITKNNWQQVN
jgi:hypothetical protein